MKQATLSLAFLATLFASGCKKEESNASPAGALPTQEELDKKAAQEIDESNADQELKELESEIEQDR